MMKLQGFWRVAFLVLFQFIARKGSGGVFAADFLPKKSGEQFPGAAACDKKLLALLFPEAYEYDGGSDSAAGQDNAAHQRQTAAAFGNSYISIPFDNPQLQTALNCYKGFPTYMEPNVDGDSSVMPKSHDEFLTMVDNALQQEIEPEAPSGGDASLATPAATPGTDAALVTRTTVREAISREKAKAEEQGIYWQPRWTPENWSPEKFHFLRVTEMVHGLKKKVTEAVDWAAGAGRGEGDDVEGILTTTQRMRTPAVVNVVYQIGVEPAGLDPGKGPNKVRSDGCQSEALEDLRKRQQHETLDRAKQIICKSDLWTLVHLWSEYPKLFRGDGSRGVGGLQGAGRGATSKATTTWRLEFVLPFFSHEKVVHDIVENGKKMTVWTFMPPKESFRSAEELKLVQEVLRLMPVGEELRIALKTKEGGQFSDKMEAPERNSRWEQPEQTLLLRTKEFAGTGSEAVGAWMQTLFSNPRWDRRPDDLPPKAALVIGSPVKDETAGRFRGFENGEQARALQEWKSKSKSLVPSSSRLERCLPSLSSAWPKCLPIGGPRRSTETRRVTAQKYAAPPLYYDEHKIFYDSLNKKSIENIVPEWRLFGNWLNDGEGSSELFHRGIAKLLSRGREGVKDRQGIPYKQSHNLLALAAPTKEQSSSFCLAGMCKLMEKLTLQDRHERESGARRAS